MRPDPRSVPGTSGKLARYCLTLLLAFSLVNTGLGQEEDAAPNYAGTRPLASNAPDSKTVPASGSGILGLDSFDLQVIKQSAARIARSQLRWYLRTAPAERMSWGGLFACAGLGLAVLFERAVRLRGMKIIPADFTAQFLDRLHEGRLDGGRALDYCEMNPSPAAHVALAAVRRWGRPAVDLERAVAFTHRGEVERLRRNVGTLRRIAALAPLLGSLGSLLAIARLLTAIPEVVAAAGSAPAAVIADSTRAPWAPALAEALSPLILGLTIATFALVAYDSLVIRIERFSGALDRLGAETIDAIAMATQPAARAHIDPPLGPPSRRLNPGQRADYPVPARSPHNVQSPQRRAHDAVGRGVISDQDIGF